MPKLKARMKAIKRRKRRWHSKDRLDYIKTMTLYYYQQKGILDTDVIASKLGCPRKLVKQHMPF